MPRGRVIAGIDIGTEKVCTIIASESEETGKTNVIGVSATPSKGLRKSQIVDLEEAIQSITESVEAAERMGGLNISTAYVTVSGNHIASQNSKGVVAVSEPDGEITASDVERVIEAARAVSLPSAREIIHVIPRDFVVDGQGGIKDPVGMAGVRLEAEAHLITGSSATIRNTTKCISELGINVLSPVFSGLAAAAAVLTETEKELGVVMLDIGAGTTSIAAFIEGSIIFSSVIPIGARNITNDLAIGMRVSLNSAEKVKLHLSQHQDDFVPPQGAKATDIAKMRKEHDIIDLAKLQITEESATASKKALVDGIIKPRLSEIFTLVGHQLHEAGLTGKTPAGIVLTGGGAETVAAIEMAKRVLSLPARIGIPKGLDGLVDELSAPMYAAATGLILYGKRQTHVEVSPHSRDNRPILARLQLRGLVQKAIDLVKSLIP